MKKEERITANANLIQDTRAFHTKIKWQFQQYFDLYVIISQDLLDIYIHI